MSSTVGTDLDTLVPGCSLEDWVTSWDALRPCMARGLPSEFTRDEWAYLMTFVSRASLGMALARSFFQPTMGPRVFFRPKGAIAVWLPNNVSLLGPLAVILATSARVPIRVKVGSSATDLCSAFLRFAIEHLPQGTLRNQLAEQVSVERFDRHDPRNLEMSRESQVRMAFGSDEAMAAIEALPHPVGSVGIWFGNHRSEAWAETVALTDGALDDLIRVFAIYGQAGCTSPRRVVLLEGQLADCRDLRRRIVARWPKLIKRDVPMHVASQNVLALQMSTLGGWDVCATARAGAVLGVGTCRLPDIVGNLSLAIVPATTEEAGATLPGNIQTIGTCVRSMNALWPIITKSKVKRVVPLAMMHHFDALWDGQNFVRRMFEEIPVGA